MYPRQGDIIKIEGIPHRLMVVSKNYFNETGSVVVCYVSDDEKETALHVIVEMEGRKQSVYCEQMRYFDLRVRGYSRICSVPIGEVVEVVSVLQSIFDYF